MGGGSENNRSTDPIHEALRRMPKKRIRTTSPNGRRGSLRKKVRKVKAFVSASDLDLGR